MRQRWHIAAPSIARTGVCFPFVSRLNSPQSSRWISLRLIAIELENFSGLTLQMTANSFERGKPHGFDLTTLEI
jgi:hypothetical protein